MKQFKRDRLQINDKERLSYLSGALKKFRASDNVAFENPVLPFG